MAKGILKKGFKVYTPTITLKVPKGTAVRFSKIGDTPQIEFEGYPIRLVKVNGKWMAFICDTLHLVLFDQSRPPYPISYFKD